MIDKQALKPRFESKVLKCESGCWEWQNNKTRNGYGLFPVRDGAKTVNFRAHRFSYELYHGTIPDGLMVMHSCDNRRCVNPEHLSVGTAKDNSDDAVRKGRKRPFGANPYRRAQSGESNPRALLSREDVVEIRALYASGGLSQAQIGTMYSVSKNTVQAIISGRSWSDL